jgi:hypothetical protein
MMMTAGLQALGVVLLLKKSLFPVEPGRATALLQSELRIGGCYPASEKV